MYLSSLISEEKKTPRGIPIDDIETVPAEELLPRHFRHGYPTVKMITRRYAGNLTELPNDITYADLCDAVLSLPDGKALVIHQMPFWDKSQVFRSPKKVVGSIRLNTPQRFRRLGKEMNLNTSSMSINQAKQSQILPYTVIENATLDFEEDYRGIGWWGPTKHMHRTVFWDALVEGFKYYELFGDRIKLRHQNIDPSYTAESLSRAEREYEITLHPVPSTLEDGWFFIEWLDMRGKCGCEDSSFREKGATRKPESVSERWHEYHKYTGGEVIFCRHLVAMYKEAVEYSRSHKDAKNILLDPFPEPTGILNPWWTLKNRVIVVDERDGKKYRRVLDKTELDVLLGRTTAYDGLDRMWLYPEPDPALNAYLQRSAGK